MIFLLKLFLQDYNSKHSVCHYKIKNSAIEMNNTFCGIHCNPGHCPFGRRPKFIECSLVASPLVIVIQSYYKHGSGIRHHTAACVVC